MKKGFIILLFFSLISLGFLLFNPILAQSDLEIDKPADRLINQANESGFNIAIAEPGATIKTVIFNLVLYLLGFIGLIFLILIIISGIQWIQAGGNDEIINKAKARIKNAIIGFVIIGTAYIITLTVRTLIENSINDYRNCYEIEYAACVPANQCEFWDAGINFGRLDCQAGYVCCQNE